MKKFEYLDHVADLEFIAYGRTLSECFENCALAMFSAIVDLGSVKQKETKNISLSSDSPENLLHDFLDEALFIFSTEHLVFSRFDVGVDTSGRYALDAKLHGEKIAGHQILADIKAVTYHNLSVCEKNGVWQARVLCDT
ncbi:MAG: hypothetical protein MSIBF_01380 [Candidatus Altiarchaeales archaeon IMC4]|nr:MAG: hypothetical protein MSIBF_01380 [Candidatus Altiarchaeales archaeon IMC4]